MNLGFLAVNPSGPSSSLALNANRESSMLCQEPNDQAFSDRRPGRPLATAKTLRGGEGEPADAERIECLEAIIAMLIQKNEQMRMMLRQHQADLA
jgi:hypothetical protein